VIKSDVKNIYLLAIPLKAVSKLVFFYLLLLPFNLAADPLFAMEGEPLNEAKLGKIFSSIDKIYKTENEWRTILKPDVFYITRKLGTEKPFSGEYNNLFADGHYICASCGLPLFSSKHKYDAGTGWPSFFYPLSKSSLRTVVRTTATSKKVSLVCNRCEAHLGYAFEDGPPPSGIRLSINSLAIKFVATGTEPALMPAQISSLGIDNH